MHVLLTIPVLFTFFWTAAGFLFEWRWRTWLTGMAVVALVTVSATWA